jgi:predicted GIY-YIG superfamily endonuclease
MKRERAIKGLTRAGKQRLISGAVTVEMGSGE